MSRKGTTEDIPDQAGRLAVVTGANSGLGRITALELARRGAQVVVACRSAEKGETAAGEIRAAARGSKPEVRQLDLGSLESVRRFAEVGDRLVTGQNPLSSKAVARAVLELLADREVHQ